ncbi:MAG: hypothetical protein ACOC0O_04685, partial [Spirochaetota bacterium]
MTLPRTILVLMVLVLFGGLAFATGSTEADESGSDDFTFSYFTGTYGNAGDPELSTDTAIGQILYEQTGVVVKFDRLVGDLNTRIGIDLASGDMADVIMGAGGSTPMWADGSAFVPLQEQLPAHA